MSDAVLKIDNDSGIAVLTLNRPQALNAFNQELLEALDAALKAAASDKDIRCVVLTGEGRAFSAGVDLKVLAGSSISGGSIGDTLNDLARNIIKSIETMPKPVIARVNGYCFTGALEIALACDLLVVANEAILGDTHAKVGIRPTWGMTQRLPRAVGIRKAREMAFTAMNVSGKEAASIGLANYAVPLTDLDAKVGALTDAILANSGASIAAYKDLFAAAQDRGLTEGVAFEEEAVYKMGDAKDRIAAVLKK
jgi:enoyl-CoA hydratase/carnithine racemase